jgi:hypothetical protein
MDFLALQGVRARYGKAVVVDDLSLGAGKG